MTDDSTTIAAPQLPAPNQTPAWMIPAFQRYILLLVAISAIEWGSAWYHDLVLHASYPFTTPLFQPHLRYTDWTNFILRVSHYGEPGMQVRPELGLPFPYPLPSLYIFLAFIRLTHSPTTAYIYFTVSAFTVATLLFWIYLYKRTSASRVVLFTPWITLILGSPALFLLDRGNIEVFLWVFVLLGLVSFVRDWKYLAAFFFALAACMKIYPALYFLLFLARRQFKAAVLGIVLTTAFSLFALEAVGPTIPAAFHDMSGTALLLRNTQILPIAVFDLRWDHSLFGIEKNAFYTLHLLSHPQYQQFEPRFQRSLTVYSILAPLAFAAIYLLRLRRMPLLNQFMALTIFSVILPYVSYEYTLVHIYLVFACFLLFLVQDIDVALQVLSGEKLKIVMACFAIVFAPLAYLTFEIYQGQVKAVVLVILLTITLLNSMPSALFQDRVRPHKPGNLA